MDKCFTHTPPPPLSPFIKIKKIISFIFYLSHGCAKSESLTRGYPCCVRLLPDPRRAGLHKAFQFLYVCLQFVQLCPTPPIYLGPPIFFTDSGHPIKWLLGGLIRGASDTTNPTYGGPILTTIKPYIFLKLLASNITWARHGQGSETDPKIGQL